MGVEQDGRRTAKPDALLNDHQFVKLVVGFSLFELVCRTLSWMERSNRTLTHTFIWDVELDVEPAWIYLVGSDVWADDSSGCQQHRRQTGHLPDTWCRRSAVIHAVCEAE
jgi:hypothetical protein